MSFNPANSNQFVVLYGDQLTLYSIDNYYEVTEDETVIDEYRIALVKEQKAEEGNPFGFIVWDENNSIYISTQSRIDYVSTPSLSPLTSHPLTKPHPIQSLILTQKHLIVFYQSGYV